MAEKTLAVAAIKNGTVIDHITAGHALEIIRFLRLAQKQNKVTVGINLPSRTMQYKDIIKVEDRILSAKEANQVAVLAPRATINIVENFEVTKKAPLTLPDTIEQIIVCPNPRCITNHEHIDSFFFVRKHKQAIFLKCRYCEREFPQEDIKEYNS